MTTCSEVGWALPHQSLVKKMAYRFVYKQSDEGIFLKWGSSSQIILACVKLT